MLSLSGLDRLKQDAFDGYRSPRSGKPADLVEREIDGLLFEVAVRAASGCQDLLPLPSAWPLHGPFLQDIVPEAYPTLFSFYELYFNVAKRGRA